MVPGSQEADAAVVNRVYLEAQRALADAAGEPALVERARGQAEKVLRTFCAAMDWTFEVRWSS